MADIETRGSNPADIPQVVAGAIGLLQDQLSLAHLPAVSDVPDVLYHYTDVDAFKGILSERRFWASNTAYVNDQGEIQYALALLEWILDHDLPVARRAGADSPSVLGDKLMREVLRHFHEYLQVFIVCFCVSRDLLSQWRGYGGRGGYAIAMQFDALMSWGGDEVMLVPAIYDETVQRERLRELAEQWRVLFANQSSWDPDDPVISLSLGQIFAASLSDLVVSFKHKSFAEEREWRLIYRRLQLMPGTETQLEVAFRTRDGMLLPYVAMGRTTEPTDALLPATEILIGPTRFPSKAAYAVEGFLRGLGYEREGVTVSNSEIPLV